MNHKNKNKKPMIGVTPLCDDELQSIWMLPSYLQAIQGAGGAPVILPFAEQMEALPPVSTVITTRRSRTLHPVFLSLPFNGIRYFCFIRIKTKCGCFSCLWIIANRKTGSVRYGQMSTQRQAFLLLRSCVKTGINQRFDNGIRVSRIRAVLDIYNFLIRE